MSGEIFISYRRSDAAKARLLHDLLEQRGVDAWYDAQVGAGEDWRRATAKALDAAPIFVLLFSKAASESDDIGKELAAATFSKKLVVPVRIENIAPAGEFLYELASRNWFDAFDDTEARFALLADKLAAMVKGGPEAAVAASSLAAPPSPVAPPATRPWLRRPLVLGGLATAGVAAIAAVAMLALNPPAEQRATAASQRVAFFGFRDTTGTPAARALADAANDQMFQTMGLFQLDSVARDETLGTAPDKRLARAAESGARYALSGDVRSSPGGMTLSVRMVDVPSRTTLWEKSFSGPTAEIGLLPAQAAWPASDNLRCIIRNRVRLTGDTPERLTLLADRCRNGNFTNTPSTRLEAMAAIRGLTQADPDSAFVWAAFALRLGLVAVAAPASTQPALIAEAEAAMQHAAVIDPEEPYLILARYSIASAKSVPLAEFDRLLLTLLPQAEKKEAWGFANASGFYTDTLRAAGRWREALPYALTEGSNGPGQRFDRVGIVYAALGESSRARADYEQRYALSPVALNWSEWAFATIFYGVGDAETILRSPPSFVAPSVAACLKDLGKAMTAQDPKARSIGADRARACGESGDLNTLQTLAALPALGKLDAAFALAVRLPKQTAFGILNSPLPALFLPTARAMRADPRFAPLVERLGLMDYWRATKSQPDACEIEAVPFCKTLKAARS